MLVRVVDDMELRLKDEFQYLCNKYPRVAFNRHDWNGKIRENKDYLYAREGYITIPENYDPKIIKQYKGLITHNRKFAKENPNLNIILTNGYVNTHNYYELDEYLGWDEKINGICSLHNIYKPSTNVGEIITKRQKFINSIPYPNKHTYGPKPWGVNYKGKPDANHPNHINNLKVINKYRFVLSLEFTYHPMWSYDWITDRIYNAFKSKTIPIYYGCYNIDEHIPNELFIDFRKYVNNPIGLKKELESYTKQKYIDQTEKAFDFYKNSTWGNMPELEDLLRGLP